MQIGSDLFLYHEKQDAALCGVHCLNALLQGAYFTEVDLMSIARELDEFEKQTMMASGLDSTDFLKFMAEESGNVDESGNYSIQVLSKALEIWGISVVPLMSPEAVESRKNPLIEKAFICNLQSHWLTIRKIGDDWYNLNSLLEQPQYLSPFYLSAFLDTLIAKGYTIFCVRGELPRVIPDPSALDSSWKKVKKRSSSQSSSNDPDKELQAALEASELEAAISLSLQKDAESNQEAKRKAEEIQPEVDEEDEELMAAIRMSQQLSQTTEPETMKTEEPEEPEPEKGEGIAEIMIRLPDSSVLKRRFHKSKTISDVLKFAKSKANNKTDKFQLMSNFPRKVYENETSTLESEGLYPGATLILQKI